MIPIKVYAINSSGFSKDETFHMKYLDKDLEILDINRCLFHSENILNGKHLYIPFSMVDYIIKTTEENRKGNRNVSFSNNFTFTSSNSQTIMKITWARINDKGIETFVS